MPTTQPVAPVPRQPPPRIGGTRNHPRLEVPHDLEPMEAVPVDALPTGEDWLFEPKYDGFRCLAFKDGAAVDLRSRTQKPLGRYFPELVEMLAELPVACAVLDGEIVIRDAAFETLQLRLHPAASRITRLSQESPATIVAFDLLADARGHSLLARPYGERRAALAALMKKVGKRRELILSKSTRAHVTALKWMRGVGHGLDGVVAKRLDLDYRAGERAMLKHKLWKTIDCVVGGLYVGDDGRIDSLLLGLYDNGGLLHFVGRAPVHKDAEAIMDKLRPLIGGAGFTGRAPGGKSRWTGKARTPVPLRPREVVEVSADHITGDYMRHGARLLRWRPDKKPESCGMRQIR